MKKSSSKRISMSLIIYELLYLMLRSTPYAKINPEPEQIQEIGTLHWQRVGCKPLCLHLYTEKDQTYHCLCASYMRA